MSKILNSTAEDLQLYFSLGDMSAFKRFNSSIVKNFKEKDKFSKLITGEIKEMQEENVRIDLESGVKLCRTLIEEVYVPVE